MPRTKAPENDSLVSRRVLVNIKRDQTTSTPCVVWAHEFPLLELIWGEGNVSVVEAEEIDKGFVRKAGAELMPYNKSQDEFKPPSEGLSLGWAFVGDAREEYDRMVDAYGNVPETRTPFAEAVYGRFAAGNFARAIGRPTVEDLPESQLRHLLLANGYHLPVVTWESSEAERVAGLAAIRKFNTAPKAELVKLAAEMDVLN